MGIIDFNFQQQQTYLSQRSHVLKLVRIKAFFPMSLGSFFLTWKAAKETFGGQNCKIYPAQKNTKNKVFR